MIRRLALADTGPLYAAIDTDDQHHRRATEEADELVEDGWTIAVAYPTLFEAYSLVYQRLGLGAAHLFVREIRERAGVLVPSSDDFARACGVPPSFPDQRLSLFDSLLAVMSDRLGAPVWTFDSHFDVMRTPVWRRD
jgi:predicted nucleic acid-binding protein